MALINNTSMSLKDAESAFADIIVRRAVEASNDNAKAAERLQVSKPTLYRRLKASKPQDLA